MLSQPVISNVNDLISSEEQQNYMNLIKKTIETDLIKNGVLNRYITVDGIIDLSKLKLETEDLRKKLVLAQSMINSLKHDLEELSKENADLKQKASLYVDNHIEMINNTKTKDEYEYAINELQNENELLVQKNKELLAKVSSMNKYNSEQNNEIHKRLSEYQMNYEKINSDFEKLLTEKNELEVLNSKLLHDNKTYKDNISLLEIQIDKLTSNSTLQCEQNINEDYKKMYNELLIENSNIKMLLNTINQNNQQNINDIGFINQNIGDYYTKLQSENSQLQIENEKIKIDLQNALNEKNNLDKQNENCKLKLKNLNLEKVKLTIDNDKLTQTLNALKNEIEDKNTKLNHIQEMLSKEKVLTDENIQRNTSLQNQYDDIKQKYSLTHEKYLQNESQISSLKEQINTLQHEKTTLQQLLNDKDNVIQFLENKNAKYENDNFLIKQSETQLKQIVAQTEDKVEETIQYNDRINNQIKQMENELENKETELTKMRNEYQSFENMVIEKLNCFDTYVESTKAQIHSILHLLYTISTNFDKTTNNNLDSLFSKQFSKDINKTLSQINSINNINKYELYLDDTLFFDTVYHFISSITNELDIVYNKMFDSNKCIRDSYTKLNTIELEMKTKTENELGMFQDKVNELEEKVIDLTRERDKLYNEYTSIKSENYSLQKVIEKNGLDVNELKTQNKEFVNKISQNENKVLYVMKSRKHLVSIIQKFIRTHPYKDLAKVMLEIINLNESIAKIEVEKFIVDEKLNTISNEYNALMSDKTYAHSDLSNIVYKERTNLEKLNKDYETKLKDKKEKFNTVNELYKKIENYYLTNQLHQQSNNNNINNSITITTTPEQQQQFITQEDEQQQYLNSIEA